MKKILKLPILCFASLCVISTGCKETSDNSKLKQEYYPSGNLRATVQIAEDKKNGLAITYYENGKVESMGYYVDNLEDGEIFFFYPNGYLQKKFIMKMGVLDGLYYAFYSNGVIKEFRRWVNGKKEGYGEDYWESNGNIKGVYYSNNDTLVFRRLFDSLGLVTKTEGKPPVAKNDKVN